MNLFLKNLTTFLLLFLFLTTNTPLGQIFRLPTFLHHYSEHVMSENSTILDFFAEHYSKTINHPDDKHQDHKNLPLRSISPQVLQILAIASKPFVFHHKKPQEKLEIQIVFQKEQSYFNSYLKNIWHPPRWV